MTHSIEDLLLFATGLKTGKPFDISISDRPLLSSIARQVSRNIGLTDRQHQLLKEKLSAYKDQFLKNGIDSEPLLNVLRIPLREVDREKTIALVHSNNVPMLQKRHAGMWVAVKFPFSKKMIVSLQEVAEKCSRFYMHEKGTHVHYFQYNESTVDIVVEAFQSKNFTIQQEILDFYNKVQEVKMLKEDHIPGFYKNELRNLRPAAVELIQNELGGITPDNLVQLYDRRRRYGLHCVEASQPETLTGSIAFREDTEVNFDPEQVDIAEIASSLNALNRFPMLVLIDDGQELEQVSKTFDAFLPYVSANEHVCLFRVDTSDEYNVNNFINDKGFGKWLDKNSKVVYINKNKLPKLLQKASWTPMSVLALTSLRANSYVATYVCDVSDLIVYHDKQPSLYRRKTVLNGYY